MLASVSAIFRMFSAGRGKEGAHADVAIPGLHHCSVAGPRPCDTGPFPTFSTADSLRQGRGRFPDPADRRWLSAPVPTRVSVRDLGRVDRAVPSPLCVGRGRVVDLLRSPVGGAGQGAVKMTGSLCGHLGL